MDAEGTVTIKFSTAGLSNGQLIHLASVLGAMIESASEAVGTTPGSLRWKECQESAADLQDGFNEIEALVEQRLRELRMG